MPIPIVLGVVAGLSALYKVYRGAKQKKDAKNRAARNARPAFSVQDEYFDNQSIAQNQAAQGFTSKTVDNYNTQTERGFQAAIDAQLQSGAGAGTIQNTFANYNLSNRNFAAADSEKQTANIENLYARNKDLAAQKVQRWVINDYSKFKDEAAAIAQESAAGEQNINTGISEGVSVVAGLTSAGSYASLLKTGKKVAGTPAAGVTGGDDRASSADYFSSLSTPSGTESSNQFSDYYNFIQQQEKANAVAKAVSTANGVEGGLTQQQLDAIGKIVSGKYNFKDEEVPSPF